MLWGHLYGVLLVGEPETVFAVAGSALIASGVVSLSLRPSPQKGAASEAAASCGDPAAPPCRTHAGEALADWPSAAAESVAHTPVPEGSPEGLTELGVGGASRAGLGQRLRAWCAGRGRREAHARAPEEDAAEAEGLIARGSPRGCVLQGQWSGTAESPDHVSLLVPRDDSRAQAPGVRKM